MVLWHIYHSAYTFLPLPSPADFLCLVCLLSASKRTYQPWGDRPTECNCWHEPEQQQMLPAQTSQGVSIYCVDYNHKATINQMKRKVITCFTFNFHDDPWHCCGNWSILPCRCHYHLANVMGGLQLGVCKKRLPMLNLFFEPFVPVMAWICGMYLCHHGTIPVEMTCK